MHMLSYISSKPNIDLSNPNKCLAIIGSIGITYITYHTVTNYLRRRRLLELIAQKRRKRDETITKLRQQLQNGLTNEILAKRREIVELGFEELRSRLQNGQLSAVEVVEAFQWKALEAHEKTNFACDFVLEARRWAEELDAKYGDGKETKPTLFGIPYSNKECFHLAGYDATGGFAQFLNQPVSQDGEMAVILKQAGAIPFVTTNVPTTMFSTGCSNLIYGDTTTPYNPKRTSGGSTGGEGAVIGSRGSPLGIGGDIGGSVRTPATNCGICSLKPTVGRLTGIHGVRAAADGITAIQGTFGPMGIDVDSLVWFMRTVCAPENRMFDVDPYAIPMVFNDEIYNGTNRLTIGYYDHDNWITASPAVRRAVNEAKQILESKGHRLIPLIFPFTVQEMRELMEIYVAGIFPDGGAQNAQTLALDVCDPAHAHFANFCSWPIWYRKLKSYFTRSPYWRTIYRACEWNTRNLTKKYAKIDAIKMKFYQFWRQHKLDCLICPVNATPALPVNVPPNLFFICWSYCALYNFVNYTAGVVKLTKVTLEDENAALKGVEFGKGGLDYQDKVCRILRECDKGSVGLPVGVQVVTLPFRDELCLRVMKDIENGR